MIQMRFETSARFELRDVVWRNGRGSFKTKAGIAGVVFGLLKIDTFGSPRSFLGSIICICGMNSFPRS